MSYNETREFNGITNTYFFLSILPEVKTNLRSSLQFENMDLTEFS
jgi:hypothetical protein